MVQITHYKMYDRSPLYAFCERSEKNLVTFTKDVTCKVCIAKLKRFGVYL